MYVITPSLFEWYTIQTKPQEELRATRNLDAWGVEAFAPTWKQPRPSQFGCKVSYSIKPLFPGYIFARFDIRKSLRTINYTRGVHRVVSFGSGPVPIQEEIIDLIRARVKDGVVEMDEDFQSGDRVRIKEGPLAGLVGIFQTSTRSKDRVSILMTTIKYQSRIVIERQLIEKH